MAQTDKEKQDKYLQCFQANEACNCEAINDVFLTGHGLSLPTSRRPVPSESGPTFSPTRTQDTVGSARLPIWAWGQGCGSFSGYVHSSPAPFPVALRTGPSALPEPGGSARAFHVKNRTLLFTLQWHLRHFRVKVPVRCQAPKTQIKHHLTGPL